MKLTYKILFVLLYFGCHSIFAQEYVYKKEHYKNQHIKSEGWMLKSSKEKFWKYYYDNGNLESQGHYKNNMKNEFWCYYSEKGIKIKEGHYQNNKRKGWWIFFDGRYVEKKCQFKNDSLDGYSFLYEKGKLVKSEKYAKDSLIGQWYSIQSFKRDNDIKELRQ